MVSETTRPRKAKEFPQVRHLHLLRVNPESSTDLHTNHRSPEDELQQGLVKKVHLILGEKSLGELDFRQKGHLRLDKEGVRLGVATP